MILKQYERFDREMMHCKRFCVAKKKWKIAVNLLKIEFLVYIL